MAYTPQTWEDAPSTATPITAARLGHIEAGVAAALRQSVDGAVTSYPGDPSIPVVPITVAGATGPYTLSQITSPPATYRAGRALYFSFTTDGGGVRITVEPHDGSAWDSYLVLRTFAGVVVTTDDDTGAGAFSKITVTLPRTLATYIVEVSGYDEESAGAFMLAIDGVPFRTPLAPAEFGSPVPAAAVTGGFAGMAYETRVNRFTAEQIITNRSAGQAALSIVTDTESYGRCALLGTGTVAWSTGDAAHDVAIARTAAATLNITDPTGVTPAILQLNGAAVLTVGHSVITALEARIAALEGGG